MSVVRALKRLGLIFFGAALATVAVLFALHNTQRIVLDFYVLESIPLPVWVIAVASLAIGFCLPSIILVGVAIRDAQIIRRQRQALIRMTEELNRLRNLPLSDVSIEEELEPAEPEAPVGKADASAGAALPQADDRPPPAAPVRG